MSGSHRKNLVTAFPELRSVLLKRWLRGSEKCLWVIKKYS